MNADTELVPTALAVTNEGAQADKENEQAEPIEFDKPKKQKFHLFKNRKTKEKKRYPIRTQLLAGFGLFTVIILALLWIFQIALLNPFYKLIKKSEVRHTMSEVISRLDDDDYIEELMDICRDKNLEIMLTDEYGSKIVSIVNGRSDFFDLLGSDMACEIYSKVSNSGGEEIFTLGGKSHYNQFALSKEESFVYIKLCSLSNGESRMIVLTAELTPVDATRNTLEILLIAISAVMILMAVGLAIVLSKGISKPIESINESAKKLAEGDYETEFNKFGSKETSELADTLNYARKELDKVESLRRELIANVSHDLRTPLTMIKGYSEVMRDIPGENTPQNVQVIIDETERLTSLVNDMLDISKLESGNMKIDPNLMNLTQSIKAILHRYDKLSDYHFTFDYDEEIWVVADELKISQVVYNLVNNALTYTGEDKSISIKQERNGDRVRVSVTDTGEGIAQDQLQNIWNRYYKVDKAHKRAQRGTGLGLSIVKKILDLHGGAYGVVSTIGVGSTFWFELDIAEDIAKGEE